MIEGYRRVRAAGIPRHQTFLIENGTWVSDGNNDDNSADITLRAYSPYPVDWVSTSPDDNAAIILEFPESIPPSGRFRLLSILQSLWGVNAWTLDSGDFSGASGMVITGHMLVYPIIDFNGLSMSDLRWSNHTDLGVGSAVVVDGLSLPEWNVSWASIVTLQTASPQASGSARVDFEYDAGAPVLGLMIKTLATSFVVDPSTFLHIDIGVDLFRSGNDVDHQRVVGIWTPS